MMRAVGLGFLLNDKGSLFTELGGNIMFGRNRSDEGGTRVRRGPRCIYEMQQRVMKNATDMASEVTEGVIQTEQAVVNQHRKPNIEGKQKSGCGMQTDVYPIYITREYSFQPIEMQLRWINKVIACVWGN